MKRLMDWIAGRYGYVPRERYSYMAADRSAWSEIATSMTEETSRLCVVLQHIIAQDTPNGNATVKRMVKIARDGLGGAA
jgi:hypothetical protein